MNAHGFPLNTYAPPYSIGGQLMFTQVGTKSFTWQDNYYTYPSFVRYDQVAQAGTRVVFDCTGDRAALHHGGM